MSLRSFLRRAVIVVALLALAAGTAARTAAAQVTPTPAPDSSQNAALRAYLDCNERGCDFDFLVTEMKWVNWMRERLDADFHMLVTSEETGAGGARYTVVAIGQRAFAGRMDTLAFTSNPNDADDAIRKSLLRVFGQLLLPHAAKSPLASRLTIAYEAPDSASSAAPAKDRWNFWTYSISANGFTNGESKRSYIEGWTDLSANRTTEAWKIRANVNGSRSQEKFQYDTGTAPNEIEVTELALREAANASAMAVKSYGDHWSFGGRGIVSTTVYNNLRLATQVSAAAEWDYFPYKDFTRKKFAVLYTVGVRDLNYRDTTVYLKVEETRPIHTLDATYGAKQTWGEANVTLFGTQYLDELKFYNMGLRGYVEVKVGKGLSFEMNGQVSRVRNQLYLPKGSQSQSEVLLQLQARQTGFRYFGFFGIRYQFGSIFNSVVNPRFGNIGGIDDF